MESRGSATVALMPEGHRVRGKSDGVVGNGVSEAIKESVKGSVLDIDT